MTGEADRHRGSLHHSLLGGGAEVVEFMQGAAWVVAARGEFDMDTSGVLTEVLERAAREHSRVVDASAVTLADSMFLTLLLRVHGWTDLRLAAPAPQVRRVLELTGADQVLVVWATLEDAISA
ncbi:STAS domain-containing protein [Streptomyces sp. NPDC001604]|uniref:STAS domain-containing protein n=1 Tax=Streptomyces sp. NPDC001604 TaxID=3364593 RepID=UPI00369A9D8C